jgi:poly(3-hydroxybutyrate) depolymerase
VIPIDRRRVYATGFSAGGGMSFQMAIEADTGRTTSAIERQRCRPGLGGRELWYYKVTGMGHAWPNPRQGLSGHEQSRR